MARRSAHALEADAPPVDTDPWRAYLRSLPKDKAADECRAPSCRKPHVGRCGWRKREVDAEGHIRVTDEQCGLAFCADHLKTTPSKSKLCPYHAVRARELGLLS